jgi:hypothetical protein
MTASDVKPLSDKLDRIEERLRMMEQAEAARRGADMTKGQFIGVVAVISSVTGVVTAIVGQIL